MEDALTTPAAANPLATSRADRLRPLAMQDPANDALRLELFDALLAEGRAEEAAALAQQVPADAAGPAWRYRLGVAQSRAAQWDAAATTLGELCATLVPAPPAALHELALVQLRRGQDAEAVRLLAEVTAPDEHLRALPQAEGLLLRTLHRLGRLDEALEVGQRALRRRPGEAALRAALATVCLDAERSDLLPALLAEGPGEGAPMARAELASARGYLALQDDDADAARAAFERSLASAPDFARSHLGLGLALATQGALHEAEAPLQRALQGMPGHLGSWHALAWLQLARGDIDAAEATFAQVLERDPTFAESHGGMAVVAALRGRREEAQRLLRVALGLDRECASALAAQLVLRHGRLDSPALLRDALAALARRPGVRLPARVHAAAGASSP